MRLSTRELRFEGVLVDAERFEHPLPTTRIFLVETSLVQADSPN